MLQRVIPKNHKHNIPSLCSFCQRFYLESISLLKTPKALKIRCFIYEMVLSSSLCMKPDDIIPYAKIVAEEGQQLQKGMNYASGTRASDHRLPIERKAEA